MVHVSITMPNVITFVNARTEVMKWIVRVTPHCISGVVMPIAYHPGDNVMVSMIVMICLMKIGKKCTSPKVVM